LLEYSLFNKKEKNSIKKYLVISVEIIPPVILFILSNTIGKFIFMILIFALLFIKNKKTNSTEKQKNDTSKGSKNGDINGYNSSKNEVGKSDENNEKKFKREEIIYYLIVGTIIFSVYLMAYGIVYSLGSSLGGTLKLNTKSKITYYNTDKDNNYKSLNGIVVQQDGNTYYISSENRELIVISSPYVVIEPYNESYNANGRK